MKLRAILTKGQIQMLSAPESDLVVSCPEEHADGCFSCVIETKGEDWIFEPHEGYFKLMSCITQYHSLSCMELCTSQPNVEYRFFVLSTGIGSQKNLRFVMVEELP